MNEPVEMGGHRLARRHVMTNNWKLSSPSALLTAVLVAFLVWLAVFAVVDPAAAAKAYGARLVSSADDTWLYVKAGRDLGLAIMLATLLLARERRAVGLFVIAACVIPLADFVIVTRHGEHLAYALAVHGSAVVYQIVLGSALLRRRRDTELHGHRGVISQDASPSLGRP